MQGSTVNKCKSILLAELAQARELLIQLNSHAQPQHCKILTPKILSSIEKSIYIAKSLSPEGLTSPPITGDFPQFCSNSPCSENSNQKENSKKRKTLPKWTNQVRLGAVGGAVEGLVDDGYSWRKYGQKDILGAKHPRGYYRCTHRMTQGCLATKQVQRSDEDPQVFDITYHGAHSCLNKSRTSDRREHKQSHQSLEKLQQQREGIHNPDLLLSFQRGLQVKTEGLNCGIAEDDSPASFVFGASQDMGFIHDGFFSSLSTAENTPLGSSCPNFFSPTTSESTYFSVSPCGLNGFELEQKLQNCESDVAEIISTPKSSCSSTIVDMDFMLDLDTDFNFDQFDTSSFF